MSDSQFDMNEVEYDRKGRMIGSDKDMKYAALVCAAFTLGMILYALHCLFAVCANLCNKGVKALDKKVADAR
jgi:hypothetical protein